MTSHKTSPADARPSIALYVHPSAADAAVESVLRGLEEERIPVDIKRSDELNPLVLAHEAAVASALGVGMGMSLDYAVITTEALPERRPYIACFAGHNLDNDRFTGSNAARIVKGTPLRMHSVPTGRHDDTSTDTKGERRP